MGSFCISIVDLATRTVHLQSLICSQLNYKKMSLFGMEQIQKLEKTLESYPSINSALVSLEKKTKIQKLYLIYGCLSIVITWLMFGYGAQLLCNAIGFVYPAYYSIKALESARKDDGTQWLVYWVVFAAFSVCEFFSDILVGWVPFYWFLKCTFLTWCMSPLNGSATIYNNILLPLFNRNQSKIDNVLNRGKSLVDQGISEAVKIASEVESKKSE